MEAGTWPWLAVAATGVLHGLNPLTGWVFAAWRVTTSGDWRGRTLLPIAAGQLFAVVAVAAAVPVALDAAATRRRARSRHRVRCCWAWRRWVCTWPRCWPRQPAWPAPSRMHGGPSAVSDRRSRAPPTRTALRLTSQFPMALHASRETMHLKFRLSYLGGVLLLAGVPVVAAESPMASGGYPLPDPVAPAVVGRPLNQIRPARPKPIAIKPAQPAKPRQLAATPKAAPSPARAPARVAAAPKPSAPATAVASKNTPPAAATAAMGAPAAASVAPSHTVAKAAVDDRIDPTAQVTDDVGKGSRLMSRRLAPGAYFNSRHQALVRKYYETHPVRNAGGKWQIGDPLPERAKVEGVPDELRAALPPVPPGL